MLPASRWEGLGREHYRRIANHCEFLELKGQLILFEDAHLLVVNKPAGWNTHSPAPFTGEGIYDWLRHREPRWADLAIIHRLDKETSGVLVFSKTSLANRSLTQQFQKRSVHKTYLLVTDRSVKQKEFTVTSSLARAGEKYVSRPVANPSHHAQTHFRVRQERAGQTWLEARPITGRTHQIRVHAAEHGFPILGDSLYGGTRASRVHLHAAELRLIHPGTSEEVAFSAAPDFSDEPPLVFRAALISTEETNAFRLVHGAADGHAGWYVDRLGDALLSQSESSLTSRRRQLLETWMSRMELRAAYHKTLTRQVGRLSKDHLSPELVAGNALSDERVVRENGVSFALSFDEGYSIGLFLDQRDNRRRFLINHVAAGFPLFERGATGAEVLNTFAYTCGFSVCAALAGARVTSVDLSKKYLEWGKRNFSLNKLDASQRDFLHGDAFDWMRRFQKKKRSFDAIILDPPTFSKSKEGGTFQAEKDYHKLVAQAAMLLNRGGVLLTCNNTAGIKPKEFIETAIDAAVSSSRTIIQQQYAPPPPDFPITREGPGHFKSVWLKVENR